MHPSYVAIDPAALRGLYVDERLTMLQIAARLGCSEMTIRRRLLQLNIPARPRGSPPKRKTQAWSSATSTSSVWSSELAYAVGLIATDGNLSSDGRHLAIPSKDLDLLESLQRCLGLRNRITRSKTSHGHIYRLQWSDRGFYDWLLSIGLTPAKSLTLGPLTVPKEHFADFFRGCIDGDGSIVTYVDHYNTSKKLTYVYTRLYVSLVSASPRFVEWLRATVRDITGASGDVAVRRASGRNDIWRLRYAKGESLALLRWIYYAPDVPCLGRKRDVAVPFLRPRDAPSRRGPGRPVVL